MIGRTLPVVISAAVLGGMTVAGLLVWGLSAAAKPRDFDRRMAAVEAQLQDLAKAPPARQASPYSQETLCSGPLIPAANALRDGLGRQAAKANLATSQISVAPMGGVEAAPGLSALDVSLTVEGPYANARQFLGGLQASSPEVFVDSFEIRPAGSSVRLRVTGRAFCSTSSRR